jgi:hypothetical protein
MGPHRRPPGGGRRSASGALRLWACPARSALLVAGPVVPNDSDVIGRGIYVVAGAAQLVVAGIGAGCGGPGGRAGGAVQGIAARCKLMRSLEQRGAGAFPGSVGGGASSRERPGRSRQRTPGPWQGARRRRAARSGPRRRSSGSSPMTASA